MARCEPRFWGSRLGATGCTERPSTAPNGTQRCATAPTPACGFSFPQVRVGAASCFTQLHSTAVNSSQRHSMSPGRGVSAAQGGKDLVSVRALQVGADWVQRGEVVTVSEVLTGFGRRGAP